MKLAVTNTILIIAMVLTVWAIFRALLMVLPVLWPILWPILACFVLWCIIAIVMSRMK